MLLSPGVVSHHPTSPPTAFSTRSAEKLKIELKEPNCSYSPHDIANWLFRDKCTWEGNCTPLHHRFTACLLQHRDFLTLGGKKLPDSIKCLPMVTTALQKGWWTQGLAESWVPALRAVGWKKKRSGCPSRLGGQRWLVSHAIHEGLCWLCLSGFSCLRLQRHTPDSLGWGKRFKELKMMFGLGYCPAKPSYPMVLLWWGARAIRGGGHTSFTHNFRWPAQANVAT